MVNTVPHEEITYRVIAAAMHVYNKLGAGFKEEVYDRAMCIALEMQGVGLLINFGTSKLEWRRVFPPKHVQNQQQTAQRRQSRG
jgi:hypothetical protein